ncbi:protein RESPONSE TO ABA AND SALT 1-like [Argentina anserina]|uniref:protein RESPONSE TO ABA AND SALT 1-like n=1 Tax=Argentina anserina TaxID=57926 RepID=UPI0021763A03|nr:protein RESPONSE TO ABA AND SALT 1-like [Potentilla anserina]
MYKFQNPGTSYIYTQTHKRPIRFQKSSVVSLTRMSHPIRERFVVFLDDWLLRQQALPESSVKEDRQRHLIEQVLCHYQQYFHEKSRIAEEDVCVIFSPPWLSSFEKTLLWLAGFKPTLVLRMVESSVEDLNPEQAVKLDQLKAETRRSERELSETMARIQESIASPPILETARRLGRLMDDPISTLDEAMEAMKAAMLRLTESADGLRGSTVRKVVEVLSPSQTVKVLAAVAQFQLRIRSWGLQRDEQNQHTKFGFFNVYFGLRPVQLQQ